MKAKICDGCQNQRPIFKNITEDGIRYKLCQQCARKKSQKLTPSSSQIKKRSDKKLAEDRIYSILRKKYLETHERCEINRSDCTVLPTEIHHTAYRTGTNYLDTTTWKASCNSCHKWCHANPAEARESGFLK